MDGRRGRKQRGPGKNEEKALGSILGTSGCRVGPKKPPRTFSAESFNPEQRSWESTLIVRSERHIAEGKTTLQINYISIKLTKTARLAATRGASLQLKTLEGIK